MEKDQVKKGDKFIIQRDIEINGLTSWGTAYTGSFGCMLQKGTVMIADDDQVQGARGFGVIPENYAELESKLVPESDRTSKTYSGYYFVFLLEDIGDKLIPVHKRK